MKFKSEYSRMIVPIMADLQGKFDSEVKSILNKAAADHSLGSGSCLVKIRDCCCDQIKQTSERLVEITTELIDIHDMYVSETSVINQLNETLEEIIVQGEERKSKAIKTAYRDVLSEPLTREMDLTKKYNLIKIEMEHSIRKSLVSLKKDRGKTLFDRLFYLLKNNWIYVIGAVVVGMFLFVKNNLI